MILLATIYNGIIVSSTVLFQYQFLSFMSNKFVLSHINPRLRVVVCVFGILMAHTVQIWIFAIAYYFCIIPYWDGAFGDIVHASGEPITLLLDCVYFSFTSFTTLGYGDITALGVVRFLTGIEALTGFVLITWSASFLFYEMNKDWKRKKKKKNKHPSTRH